MPDPVVELLQKVRVWVRTTQKMVATHPLALSILVSGLEFWAGKFCLFTFLQGCELQCDSNSNQIDK